MREGRNERDSWIAVATPESGFALLESSALFALFLGIAMSIAGTISLLNDLRSQEGYIKEVFLHNFPPPFTIEPESASLHLDREKLRSAVSERAQLLASRLQAAEQPYYFEIGFAELTIDKESGAVLDETLRYTRSGGSLAGVDERGQCPPLPSLLQAAVRRSRELPSPFAIPSPTLSGRDAYLDSSLIVGVRLFQRYSTTAGGVLARAVFDSPVLSRCDVQLLRGVL